MGIRERKEKKRQDGEGRERKRNWLRGKEIDIRKDNWEACREEDREAQTSWVKSSRFCLRLKHQILWCKVIKPDKRTGDIWKRQKWPSTFQPRQVKMIAGRGNCERWMDKWRRGRQGDIDGWMRGLWERQGVREKDGQRLGGKSETERRGKKKRNGGAEEINKVTERGGEK